jgi:DNA-damage-inducible protein J
VILRQHLPAKPLNLKQQKRRRSSRRRFCWCSLLNECCALAVAFIKNCGYTVATVLKENLMAADSIVRARMDTKIKNEATAALVTMGLSVSDAIRLLLVRVAKEKRLPFELTQPNAITQAAMLESRKMGSARFNTAKELMNELKKASK